MKISGEQGTGVTTPTGTDHRLIVEGDMKLTGPAGTGVKSGNLTAYRLTVEGDVSVTGFISASYEDVAEWVPATADLSPGTVVVLDPSASNTVMPSHQAYDTAVAGVVSAQPGLVLGHRAPNKEQIATTGRVRVKVDATQAPINVGDLLVTSHEHGMAMRSEPMHINGRTFHQPGTIVGKALEPLRAGKAEILVLLSLQ